MESSMVECEIVGLIFTVDTRYDNQFFVYKVPNHLFEGIMYETQYKVWLKNAPIKVKKIG